MCMSVCVCVSVLECWSDGVIVKDSNSDIVINTVITIEIYTVIESDREGTVEL